MQTKVFRMLETDLNVSVENVPFLRGPQHDWHGRISKKINPKCKNISIPYATSISDEVNVAKVYILRRMASAYREVAESLKVSMIVKRAGLKKSSEESKKKM